MYLLNRIEPEFRPQPVAVFFDQRVFYSKVEYGIEITRPDGSTYMIEEDLDG